jgi:hypothetical protein
MQEVPLAANRGTVRYFFGVPFDSTKQTEFMESNAKAKKQV